MVTAIVTSDNHLGAHYVRLRPDRLEERRRYLQRALARVVDEALSRKVDLFLHAGDLFDRPDPRNADRVFAARQFSRLRAGGIPTFLIAGRHDSPHHVSDDGRILPHEELDTLDVVHLFRFTDRFTPIQFAVRGVTVCVRGLSADPQRTRRGCPLKSLSRPDVRGGDLDIVLLHHGVEGWNADPSVLSLANLEKLAADVVCVGHSHKRAKKRLKSGALLVAPGATEHIRFGEENLECGFWLLTLEPGKPAEAKYVPLDPQPMKTVRIDVTPLAEEPDIPQALRERIAAESTEDVILQVRLTGRLSRAQFKTIRLPELSDFGAEAGFSCVVLVDDLEVYTPAEEIEIGGDLDLAAALRQAASELDADADEATRGRTAQALERLLGALTPAEEAVAA